MSGLISDLQRFISILDRQPSVRKDLEAVDKLRLPEGCIAAGYLRSLVWDELHGFIRRTVPEDIDVLYYDPLHPEEAEEKKLDARLRQLRPCLNWSCKNQARMHLVSGSSPYPSIEAAMREWPETATAVAVRLDGNGRMTVIAPYGLSDLMNGRVRPSPGCRDRELCRRRMEAKRWLDRWPKLRLEDPPGDHRE
ncbi:nucleotidyltransferase family protein [Paenibacillus glufosinatiresistens]|uniref:nucleotidyltransferase family protein n=1 Tax=Paenibacillus glufosinatiresistens TaxID=3070657 RepID=UPI00286D9D39|nr:nucleotidyltransferase family protein [Paenibacillus sp. YX.27]